jgi:hypothetical protein
MGNDRINRTLFRKHAGWVTYWKKARFALLTAYTPTFAANASDALSHTHGTCTGIAAACAQVTRKTPCAFDHLFVCTVVQLQLVVGGRSPEFACKVLAKLFGCSRGAGLFAD